MVTDYRRIVCTLGAVVSLCCGAQGFVAQNSLLRSLSGRVDAVAASERTRSSGVQGGRSGGALGMAAEGQDCDVPSSSGPMNRRQAMSKVWKAAFSLSALGAATAVVAGGAAPAEAGVVGDIGGFLLPPQNQSEEIVVGDADKEVSFEDFERALLRGDVAKCEFFGPNFDKAVIVFKDGARALIGEGYPEERAFSDDSPMKVVGLLRNAGVPFTTQFQMGKYSKPKSYKSSETVEAENRQKSEDKALELLMSQ